jgi:hypothetical protein
LCTSNWEAGSKLNLTKNKLLEQPSSESNEAYGYASRNLANQIEEECGTKFKILMVTNFLTKMTI